MSERAESKRRTLVDLAPLRVSPAFARLWVGNSVSGIGAWLTMTAVGLLIFDITGSTLLVALVGPISLVPMIVAGIWGGMLADALDRRTVAIVAQIVSWASIGAIVAMAFWDAALAPEERIAVWPLYIFTTLNAVAVTITAAARQAAIPRILPEEYISRANALNGLTFGLQMAIGPALAGVLVASVGFPWTFLVDAVLFSAGFIGTVGLPRLPPLHEVVRPGWQSLKDGWAFLRRAPNLRLSFVIDIVAMSFGRPEVLFPAIAVLAIGGGPITVGILTAASAIGTMLTSLFSGPVARIHRHGIAIGRSVIVYGAFTLLFGVVIAGALLGWFGPAGPTFDQVSWPALILAAVALAGTGASDEVSAIFRMSMLQTAAPDEMRGRLQGVFMVVVTGGPRIGQLVAGLLATWIGLWAQGVIGGIVIAGLVWLLVRVNRSFRAYDERTPTP